MIKTSLPVLLIRNMVLFPWSEIRLEFDNDNDKKIVSLAESFYNNNILIVNPKDLLEMDPDVDELPKIGVISQIKMRIDMPNGKTRIILSGISRVQVHAYTKNDNLFEAMVSNIENEELDQNEEIAYVRSLTKHIEMYVKEVPYMSNTVLNQIVGINSISRITDIIALFLPTSIERKIEYIEEISPTFRAKMILDDINKDIEILKLEEKIEDNVGKELEKSQKEFVLREKIKLIKEELGEINDKDEEIEKIKEKLNTLKCNDKIKKRIEEELNKYSFCNINSPEIGIIRTYIDWMINLPWNKYTKDSTDLNKVKKLLDKTHYGLDDIKERIIEYLAVKQKTKGKTSPIICLVGPSGVGKTTLAISIANSINRKWTKISVGGVNDQAEIVGHRRTYIGASPGLIIQGMKKAGTSNPVFIIDEIDKMTKDIKGDPASSLLEVLDREQNMSFVDHYIEEEFDLSNVMFITTANYIEQIPTELRDRLEIIELSSYTEYEKLDIVKKHIMEKELLNHGLDKKIVKITDAAIMSIIKNYTKEAGVRELERLICTILRKIVKELVVDNKNKIYNIDVDNLEKYLGKPKYNDSSFSYNVPGVVNGLAYTPYGGSVLPIEAILYKGKGDIILTGSLGNVMQESANIAMSYLKSNCKLFNIDINVFKNNDFHIHIPEGAVPKEGPSAGVTLVTTLLSLVLDKKVSSNIAMTGEITLTGKVLEIGGVKEKIIAAHKSNVTNIFLPKNNERDLKDIPDYIKEKIKFHFVNNYIDIYKKIWK